MNSLATKATRSACQYYSRTVRSDKAVCISKFMRTYSTTHHTFSWRTTILAAPKPQTWSSYSNTARSASTLSSHPTGNSVLVSSPTKEYLEAEEVDMEHLSGDISIGITDRAAEQLRSISAKESDPDLALRIAVEAGGCHGYQYKLELTSLNGDDRGSDYHFMHPTHQPSHVVVDPVSLTLLRGSTLDFATELIGSSFRIVENPQAKGGCGCGVSWEAKF